MFGDCLPIWNFPFTGSSITNYKINHQKRRQIKSSEEKVDQREGSVLAAAMSNSTKAEVEGMQKKIVEFYNKIAAAPTGLMGEHLHHGFFEPGSTVSLTDHHTAQVRMIEEVLSFASISDDPMKKPKSIIDVGCGFGASSLYLARKYGAECKGIALSPEEIKRAKALAATEGLENKVSFEVADALAMPFPDGQFDLVWCLAAAEHIADKQKLVEEMVRVAAPGAAIILVSWCHRNLSPSDQSLNPKEKELLNKLCEGAALAPWCSIADYVKYFQSVPVQDLKVDDWTQYISPFWTAVVKSMLSWNGVISLFTDGQQTIKEFLSNWRMMKADKMGLSKLAAITCRKPE